VVAVHVVVVGLVLRIEELADGIIDFFFAEGSAILLVDDLGDLIGELAFSPKVFDVNQNVLESAHCVSLC
jgi:hypothetical protein